MAATNTIQQLAERISGHLVQPKDDQYDEARGIWNGMIDRRPAAIAFCNHTSDVVQALRFARENKLPFSIRCGGHGVSGNSLVDDGLVIDLSCMRSVVVDPQKRRAIVGGGAQLGDFDRETQVHGLAATAGVDPSTGVAGLTLGGGTGFLARKLGLTIDSLVGAKVVLANGSIVRANATEHPDLFWALRGGGGNFGIITEFEFALHPIGPEVMSIQVFYPYKAAREVLRFYRDFMANAPEEVGCYVLLVPVPAVEPFPPEQHGKTAVALAGCYAGDLEEGRRALEPLTSIADPLLAVLEPVHYVDLQSSFKDAAPHGERYYWKSHFIEDITEELLDLVVERTEALPGHLSSCFFEPQGGAVNRIDPKATAYPHRQALYSISMSSGWSDPADDHANIAWTRSFYDAVAPHSTGGVYSNYMDFDEVDRVQSAYGENFDRLRRVKAEYDPNNVFRLNQNIKPATGA
ncbi:FAD-binding oxidoreductase [Altererythrobacter sp. SALINAS58]|uniref:FAD-binding oxidoreductase n=1 Tax=Alteripontixanthobacter muriae TaxID=2705546 RepID=UPI001576FFAA|nr:FAD-binding oxidoreductase [Alteripontixanthobacter muriae]NTZ42148.1 FAD-binding oxidoreductase [Alteripontixanthobacter muriae]